MLIVFSAEYLYSLMCMQMSMICTLYIVQCTYTYNNYISYQDKCIESIIYVKLCEMEEKYSRFQRVHIQKNVIRE